MTKIFADLDFHTAAPVHAHVHAPVCAFCLGDRGELECTAGCTGGPVTGEPNMAREVYEQVVCDYPICGWNVPRRVRSVTLRAV